VKSLKAPYGGLKRRVREFPEHLFYSVWGRVVADIPNFNRELVAALAED
jgi:hypothetical protein